MVDAFGGGDRSCVRPLPGGQGRAWRAGHVVLKPVDDDEEAGFVADVLSGLSDGPAFRVPRPVPAPSGGWVEAGWAASAWLDGGHEQGRADDVLAVSAAFHAALAELDVPWPEALAQRRTPWAVADRVAWGEQAVPVGLALPGPALDLVRQVAAAPPPVALPRQVVHGDLEGNVLFADGAGLPPAVIDLSPYLRPAAFADAVVVADAVAWGGAAPALARRVDAWSLARAVVYRLVAAALFAPEDGARIAAEVAAYARVLPSPPP